jgi:hypothetical protein
MTLVAYSKLGCDAGAKILETHFFRMDMQVINETTIFSPLIHQLQCKRNDFYIPFNVKEISKVLPIITSQNLKYRIVTTEYNWA